MSTDTQFNDALAAHLTGQAHPRPHPLMQPVSSRHGKQGHTQTQHLDPIACRVARLQVLVVLLALTASVAIIAKVCP